MNYTPSEWLAAYQNNGFVIVPDLLDAITLAKLRARIEEISGALHTLSPELKEKIFPEREHVKNSPEWYAGLISEEECADSVRQIADLPLFDPMFVELISYPPLLNVLEVLFGSADFSFTLMVARPKAARVGSPGVVNLQPGAFACGGLKPRSKEQTCQL